MPKFKVSVTRVGYASRDFEINARDEDHAREIAERTAPNHTFSEKQSEYEADACEAIPPVYTAGEDEKTDGTMTGYTIDTPGHGAKIQVWGDKELRDAIVQFLNERP